MGGRRGFRASDPVMPQPEVMDVEFRSVDEATEEMIDGIWFPTAVFGESWNDRLI